MTRSRDTASAHADAADVPAHCPACQSREVTTASKVVDAASYWRCQACGEVWNVKRSAAAAGRVSYAPFHRQHHRWPR